MEFLEKPKRIPQPELQEAEIKRGEQFPAYILPLESRIRTDQQKEVSESLEKKVGELKAKLREKIPDPMKLSIDEAYQALKEFEDEFIDIANQSRVFADNHRAFNVGALAVGISSDLAQENPWVILFDANTRPRTRLDETINKAETGDDPDSVIVRKHCAEEYILDRADPRMPEYGLASEKMSRMLQLFVVGEPQTDDDSKREQEILTSCKLCRDRMWKESQPEDSRGEPMVSQDMPVTTAHAERPKELRDMKRVKELHDIHGELPPGSKEID